MTNFEERRRMLGLKCSVLIEDFHYFNNLEFYIKLIESFLNNQTDVQKFKRDLSVINTSLLANRVSFKHSYPNSFLSFTKLTYTNNYLIIK